METSKTTVYHLILDRSGSMKHGRIQTIESFNTQVTTIKEVAQTYPDQTFLVSLTVFNNDVVHLIEVAPVDDIKLLTTDNYFPDKSTALFDAIGEGILRIDAKFGDQIEVQAVSVVLVILTDGRENASQKYSYEDISKLIQQKEESSEWTISFLSADINLENLAKGLSVRSSNFHHFRKEGMHTMTKKISNSFRSYAREKSLGRRKKDFFEGVD